MLRTLAVSLMLLLVTVPGVNALAAGDDCGRPVDGLQMCLESTGTDLQLALRNVGDDDITLNLGSLLANGKVQLTDRNAIKFNGAQGQTHVIKFDVKEVGFVTGRVGLYGGLIRYT